MSDVTLSYKGSDILELSDSGSATLKTGGTYCEADIEVEYVKPSGGGDDSNGLVDLVFDYTSSDNKTWSGVIENNTIKNTTASAFCSPPLLLKKPICIKTGDVVAITIQTNGQFFADIGFMNPFIYLAGRSLGLITIASNVHLASTSYSKTREDADVIVDRMYLYNRGNAITSSYIITIGLSINGTVIF